jgi:hypothetical protein
MGRIGVRSVLPLQFNHPSALDHRATADRPFCSIKSRLAEAFDLISVRGLELSDGCDMSDDNGGLGNAWQQKNPQRS